MPTTARLVAALLMGGLLWFVVTDMMLPTIPGAQGDAWFVPVHVGVAALAGWAILGRHAGHGVAGAVGHGITTLVVAVLGALAILSGKEMVERALRREYDGPAEAIVAIPEIMYDRGLDALGIEAGATLLVGAFAVAMAVEIVGRVTS
ncbi:MAG: TrgA family protein [Shimia sp.]